MNRPQRFSGRLPCWLILPAASVLLACALALPHRAAQAAPPAPVEMPLPTNAGASALPAEACSGRQQALSATRSIVAKPLPHDSRLVVFPYDRNALYPVNAYFNRYTHFELEPLEKVIGAYINDETEWEMRVAATRSDLFVRPRLRGVSGSLTVITERRRYQIDLLDVAACPGEARYQRVSWSYQDGVYEDREAIERKASAPAAPAPAPAAPNIPAALAVNLEKINLAYDIEGDREIAPVSVFDDGARTFLRFSAASDARPVLLAVGADGQAEVVDYLAQGVNFIAPRLFSHGILLRLGKQEVRIRNKASRCAWLDASCRRVSAANVESAPR